MNSSLYSIARELAPVLCDVPSHTLIMLEREKDYFAENPKRWDEYRLEVDHRALQLKGNTDE